MGQQIGRNLRLTESPMAKWKMVNPGMQTRSRCHNQRNSGMTASMPPGSVCGRACVGGVSSDPHDFRGHTASAAEPRCYALGPPG